MQLVRGHVPGIWNRPRNQSLSQIMEALARMHKGKQPKPSRCLFCRDTNKLFAFTKAECEDMCMACWLNPNNLPPNLPIKLVLDACLAIEPKQRASADQLLLLDYFTQQVTDTQHTQNTHKKKKKKNNSKY